MRLIAFSGALITVFWLSQLRVLADAQSLAQDRENQIFPHSNILQEIENTNQKLGSASILSQDEASDLSKPVTITFGLLGSPSFEFAGGLSPDIFWRRDAWRMESDFTFFGILTGDELPADSSLKGLQAPDGSHFAYIRNLKKNDARWLSGVELIAGAYYLLRGKLAVALEAGESGGASLGIFNGPVSDLVQDTGGTWVDRELYFRVGPENRFAEVALRLGFFGKDVRGEAAFDQIDLRRISPEEIPLGVRVFDLGGEPRNSVVFRESSSASELRKGAQPLALVVGVGAFVFAVFATLFLLVQLDRWEGREAKSNDENKSGK